MNGWNSMLPAHGRRATWRLVVQWIGIIALANLGASVVADDFVEEFDSDPSARSWRVLGNGEAFGWNPGGWLDVRWDSVRPNGFYARALPGAVTERDDFQWGFDLVLESHEVGTTPGKPGTFELALGLIRIADASDPGFRRAVLFKSRNLVEWAWFGTEPSGTIAASLSPVMIPSDGRLPWGYSDTYLELQPGVRYGFDLAYAATNRTLSLTMTVDGEPGPALMPVLLGKNFTGFEVDAVSVNAYSDEGQDPRYAGSVRATGKVDRVRWKGPGPVLDRIRISGGNECRIRFGTRAGWHYQVQSSDDLTTWTSAGAPREGTGTEMEWIESNAAGGNRFFRVEARRP